MWSSAHCNGIIEEYQPSLKKRVPLIHIDSGGVLPNEVSRNSIKNKQKKPSSIENAVTWGRILMNKKGNRWILAELTGITGAKQIPSHEQTVQMVSAIGHPWTAFLLEQKKLYFMNDI